MHEAAILDFEVGVGEVLPTFRVGNPTSGGVPVEISDKELGNSKMVRAIIPAALYTIWTWKSEFPYVKWKRKEK